MEALEGSTRYCSTKHGNRHYMPYNITLAKISRQHQKVLSRILIYIHILKSHIPINPPLTSTKVASAYIQALNDNLLPYHYYPIKSLHRLHKVIEVVQRLKTGQDGLNTSRIRLPILHSHQLPAFLQSFSCKLQSLLRKPQPQL